MGSKRFKIPDVTKALAAQHEAGFVRLTALVEQSRATAARHPTEPVSAATRDMAKTLLDEAKIFRPREGRDAPPAEDWGGLFTQLSQALADLDAYEIRQTFWNTGQKCRMWLTTPVQPVLRLRPEVDNRPAAPKLTYSGKDMRHELVRLMKAKEETAHRKGYEEGLAAGRLKSGQVVEDVAEPQTYPRIRHLG